MRRPGKNGACGCGSQWWRVHKRRCNNSAFNGYRTTPSAYSGLVCNRCGHVWRSKAAYVDAMPDITPAERQAWISGAFDWRPDAGDVPA